MMIDYIYDDGGREATGYRGQASDCVARALAVLTERSYKECYTDLAQANARAGGKRSARNGIRNQVYTEVFLAHGLIKISPGKGSRLTYTEAHHRYGNCIVKTTHHLAALIDGALHDTFDGRTYEWEGEVRERKAQSIWVVLGNDK